MRWAQNTKLLSHSAVLRSLSHQPLLTRAVSISSPPLQAADAQEQRGFRDPRITDQQLIAHTSLAAPSTHSCNCIALEINKTITATLPPGPRLHALSVVSLQPFQSLSHPSGISISVPRIRCQPLFAQLASDGAVGRLFLGLPFLANLSAAGDRDKREARTKRAGVISACPQHREHCRCDTACLLLAGQECIHLSIL